MIGIENVTTELTSNEKCYYNEAMAYLLILKKYYILLNIINQVNLPKSETKEMVQELSILKFYI